MEIWKARCWKRMNYLFCKKGSVRGGHYHKKTRELFFMASGRCKIEVMGVNGKNKKHFLAKEEDIFLIEPYEVHYIRALEDSRIVAFLDVVYQKKAPDMFIYKEKA